MFDTFIDQRGPSHVTVTEKRAPTADSARFLKELEREAAAKITGSFVLDPNHINGRVVIDEDHIHAIRRARVVFDLNGSRHEVEAEANILELTRDKHALALKLHEAMSRRIAAEILIPALIGIPI